MNEFITFFKEIFLGKQNDTMRVGLSQFKTTQTNTLSEKKPSINTKDVKLSDLMRRAS